MYQKFRLWLLGSLVGPLLFDIYVRTFGRYYDYKRNRNFRKNGQKSLEIFTQALEEGGHEYWLDFGTLLGAVREKNFIAHDYDLDIGMWLDDYTPQIEQSLSVYGIRKAQEYVIDNGKFGRMDTYFCQGISVDIFFYIPISHDQAYYHDFVPLARQIPRLTIRERGGLIPRKITLALKEIGGLNFLGKNYPVPEPTEQHLIDRYGDDYMVVNKKWFFRNPTTNPNIEFLHDKVGVYHGF